MEHWKVEWFHESETDPTLIYSEIGEDGYEVRKVYQYRDGRLLRSDEWHESREIGLSEVPVGTIEDVARQPEFAAIRVPLAEFEEFWTTATWPSP
ncbi:DUF6881 domain-containing protein [Streptomyces goshikiensis]|uniref:DUF6881 domain-containing protein n=1 Tax=Streptomyces goshikiensis TaxID=1942 RepID=UPI0038215CB4